MNQEIQDSKPEGFWARGPLGCALLFAAGFVMLLPLMILGMILLNLYQSVP